MSEVALKRCSLLGPGGGAEPVRIRGRDTRRFRGPPPHRPCLSHTLSLTHTRAHSLSHSHTLTHRLSLSHSHTHTPSLSHTLTLSHTVSLSLAHADCASQLLLALVGHDTGHDTSEAVRYSDALAKLAAIRPGREREFFIDNLLVRIHFSIVMIRWTGLASWEFEFPFPGGLISTFLAQVDLWHSCCPPKSPFFYKTPEQNDRALSHDPENL